MLGLTHLWKCLNNQRGEVVLNSENPASPADQPPWHATLPDTLVVEHEGKKMPLKEVSWIKETPDVPTLAKRFFDTNKEFGSRVKIPAKDAKPEEISAFKTKLYQSGILSQPPESPDKYLIDLSRIPEPLRSDAMVKAVREWAHKFGVSQDAITELVALETKRYEEVDSVIKYDRAEAEKSIAALAQKEGLSMQEVMAYGGAWLVKNISEQDLARLKASGLADNPQLAWMIAKAGRDSGEDISIAGTSAADPLLDQKSELNAILADKAHAYWNRNNPGHDMAVEKVYGLFKLINPERE